MSEAIYGHKKRKQSFTHSRKPNSGYRILSIFCIFTLIIAFCSGCITIEPEKVGEYNAPNNTATAAPSTEEKTFSVGEIVELQDVQVVLLDVIESTGSTYNLPEDGNIYVLCEFEITNNSNKEVTVSSFLSFEAYCDDYVCSESFGALLEKGNRTQLDGTVAAGKKMKGVIGYEVPVNWSELEVHFKPNVWNSKDITFIATND